MGVKIRNNNSSINPVQRSFGLGDAVEAVAKPIARAVGLNPDCAPCKRRKEKLNALSDAAKSRVNAIGRRLFRPTVTVK